MERRGARRSRRHPAAGGGRRGGGGPASPPPLGGRPPAPRRPRPGAGRICGQRLVEHPDVAKIAFTGSTEVGRRIAEGAAATIKRVTLELGGKSANVVFADADLDRAAAEAPLAVFGNAGQDCCAR